MLLWGGGGRPYRGLNIALPTDEEHSLILDIAKAVDSFLIIHSCSARSSKPKDRTKNITY